MEINVIIALLLAVSGITIIIVSHIKENLQFRKQVRDFKVGDRFQSIHHCDNPFKETVIYEMEVIEIRDGWAKYKWGDGSGSEEPIERIIRMYVKTIN